MHQARLLSVLSAIWLESLDEFHKVDVSVSFKIIGVPIKGNVCKDKLLTFGIIILTSFYVYSKWAHIDLIHDSCEVKARKLKI